MNATFNIRRLGLTIYKELQEKYLTILGTIGIVLLAYLFLWGLNLLGHDPVPADNRIASVTFILSVVTCLAPFIIYKNENRRMEGVFYAVSPASTLEKTISMFVICSILFPLLAAILTLTLDSLLTLFPFDARYTGSLWSSMFSSREYLDATLNHPMIQYSEEAKELSAWMYNAMAPLMVSPFIGFILGQSVFLFLNMLFRRNKIGYTLLVFFIVSIIGTIGITLHAINYFDIVDSVNTEAIYEWTIRWIKAFTIIITYILPVIFWVLTYFRIRRIQY